MASADILLMTRESIASRRDGAATDTIRTMSATRELLIYGAFFVIFLLLYFTLGFRKAKPRADGRTPLFLWGSAGEYRRFRYTVARTRMTRGSLGVPMNASSETIAFESGGPLGVRFLVDAAHVYRGVSDLFHGAKVTEPIAAPDLAPFWRSDEPERLQALVRDTRFARILEELRTIPDFAALAAASTEDARISMATLGRSPGRDALILTRSGFQVPFRDEHDVDRDLEILTRLRELFASLPISDALERASVPTKAATYTTRGLRTVGMLFVALAGVLLFMVLVIRNCG
jgi:hypothetical protein